MTPVCGLVEISGVPRSDPDAPGAATPVPQSLPGAIIRRLDFLSRRARGPGKSVIRGKTGARGPLLGKSLKTIARTRPVPSNGAARSGKTAPPFGPHPGLKRVIIRHLARKLHGFRVKLKACPERGSYKS